MKIRPDALDKANADRVGAAETKRPGSAGHRADDATAAKAVAPTPSVHISDFKSRIDALRAKLSAGDGIDTAKVERISQALSDGTLRVDSDVVADRMLKDAAALLAKPQ